MALTQSEEVTATSDELSKIHCAAGNTLNKCLENHLLKEAVSFHTPGHKGRLRWTVSEDICRYDLTELPGLDDLSQPRDVLARLENRIAKTWDAEDSIISVNGASNAILAALLAVAPRGDRIFVPRNSHRSVISGLVLGGFKPIWYDPRWQEDWGLWADVEPVQFAQAVEDEIAKNGAAGIAGAVLVSPTYTGDVTDVRALAQICHEHSFPLIVDEAHGAHFLTSQTRRLSGLASGADLIVHSFHKNLDAFTQCGAVHISHDGARNFGFSASELRAALSTTQSSSPSYLLLRSIDEMLSSLETGETIDQLSAGHSLGRHLKQELAGISNTFCYESQFASSPFHILFRKEGLTSEELFSSLSDHGVFAEGCFGDAILLMLGVGTIPADLHTLIALCRDIEPKASSVRALKQRHAKPAPLQQVISPRQAVLGKKRRVLKKDALGAVAAECVSSCPPGWPSIVPGQKVSEEVANCEEFEFLRVVDSEF
jgi:arginine/lysine/ornithine decarboxylase